MRNNEKKIYSEPVIEIIEIDLNKSIATSGDGVGLFEEWD